MSASDLALVRFHQDRGAVISACERYRYWLHRRWVVGQGWTVFIMLNPSTADAEVDDPTIRRCISFAKRWGSQGLIVVNLFAARATDPRKLITFGDPEGPQNHAYVLKACELAAEHEPDYVNGGKPIRHGKLVCAWGAHDTDITQAQVRQVAGWIDASCAMPLCLGKTKSGAPRHPLYVPKAAPLETFAL